jgi:CheY-like chemotaxis protein
MSDQNAPLILVVDDYQDAREMYAEYLQFSGFRVAEARNGNEAVDQAFALKPLAPSDSAYISRASW